MEKKKGCPPFSTQFNELYQPPYYIVVELFDLESHVKRMREKHPTWTDNQCRNLLYWQKTITKSVKKEANLFIENSVESNLTVVELPEATGINIFMTCKNINLPLERNPQKTAAKIMLIAKKCS